MMKQDKTGKNKNPDILHRYNRVESSFHLSTATAPPPQTGRADFPHPAFL